MDVVVEFVAPEIGIGRWQFGESASGMTVPEAPVNENGHLPARQNNVGAAWKISSMQAEAESFGEQCSANEHLGFSTFPPDACHHPAALRGTDYVGHLGLA
jgi:hypothetical protein